MYSSLRLALFHIPHTYIHTCVHMALSPLTVCSPSNPLHQPPFPPLLESLAFPASVHVPVLVRLSCFYPSCFPLLATAPLDFVTCYLCLSSPRSHRLNGLVVCTCTVDLDASDYCESIISTSQRLRCVSIRMAIEGFWSYGPFRVSAKWFERVFLDLAGFPAKGAYAAFHEPGYAARLNLIRCSLASTLYTACQYLTTLHIDLVSSRLRNVQRRRYPGQLALAEGRATNPTAKPYQLPYFQPAPSIPFMPFV